MGYFDDLAASAQPEQVRTEAPAEHTDVTLQAPTGLREAPDVQQKAATPSTNGSEAQGDLSSGWEGPTISAAAQLASTGLAAQSVMHQAANQRQLANTQSLMNVMNGVVRGNQKTGADQGRAISTFLSKMR